MFMIQYHWSEKHFLRCLHFLCASRAAAQSCSAASRYKNWVALQAPNAQTIQTPWKMTRREAEPSDAHWGSWLTKRISFRGRVLAVSPDQEKPSMELLKGKKKERVINLILLVSSEMLCLRSFHGDRGVPWWLIDTQGAIHLYTGCVRGRAAGTSAPTTNPKCKCKRVLHRLGLTDLNLPSDCVHFHAILWSFPFFPLMQCFFFNSTLVPFLPNALIVLTDTKLTSYCTAECSNEFTETYSAQQLLW